MTWLRAFFRPLARCEAEFLSDVAGVVALGTLVVGLLSLGGW